MNYLGNFVQRRRSAHHHLDRNNIDFMDMQAQLEETPQSINFLMQTFKTTPDMGLPVGNASMEAPTMNAPVVEEPIMILDPRRRGRRPICLQVKLAIIEGLVLAKGDATPTERELAARLKVCQTTVNKYVKKYRKDAARGWVQLYEQEPEIYALLGSRVQIPIKVRA